MQKQLHFAFFVVFFGQLISRFLESEMLDYILKPMIMPCLALLFIYPKNNAVFLDKFSKLILIAFFFSWLGDIALMFDRVNPNFFLLGLSAFLIAHICYIFAFYYSSQNSKNSSLFATKPYLFLPLLAYGGGLFYFLLPNLHDFTIPVLIYALVISMMACFALNRKNKVNMASFNLLFYGSLLFVLSDSLIALNKFLLAIPHGGLWVMLTYMLAQYLIMRGSKLHLIN